MFANRIITGNFTHSEEILPEISDIVVHNTDNGRYYEVSPGVFYPSITTVLGESVDLQWWRDMKGEAEADRIMKTAAARGSQMHDLLERYISNIPIHINSEIPQIKTSFLSGRTVIDKINFINFQEKILLSHDLKVAGRTDVFGEYEGIKSVIDFKTANRPKDIDHIENYFCQATAYKEMAKEMYGFEAKQIVIIVFVDFMTEPQVFRQTPERYIGVLKDKITNFKGKYNGKP